MPVEVPSTPNEVPVNTRPTPEVLDTLAYEIVEAHQPAFVRGNYGMANPDPETPPSGYEGFQLVKEETVSHDKVKRWWYNGAVNQDCYNYDKDYVFDSADHPLFKRRYITRRDLYEDLPRGTTGTLDGVWMIRVTNGGTEYDPDNPPTVTVAGNATAEALVKPDGSVGWIYITSEGSGYVAAPAVTIAASAGVQATAEAVIQATSCVLVSQKSQELPQEDPRRSLYVMEVRLYQTFPGPELLEWRHIPRIDRYALLKRQLILNSTIPADNNTESYPDGTTVEYQEITDVYGVKITTVLPTTGFVWESSETPNDFTYEGTEDYRFPDQIRTTPQLYMLVAVNGSGNAAFDFALQCEIEEGYVGPCRAIFKERYTYDPTDAAFIADLPAPTLVIPTAHTIRTGVVYYGSNGQVSANFYTWPIPAALHPAFNYDSGDIIVNGSGTLPVGERTFDVGGSSAATTPPGFDSGDSILRASAPQRLGIGGLWCVYIIEIFHP